MALTDAVIRRTKAGPRLLKLSVGGGLQVWISPTGGKHWNFAYRFAGKQKKLSIGPYGTPPVGLLLDAARVRRNEANALLREGIDPAAYKQRAKAIRAQTDANTFAVIADELLAKKRREGLSVATIGKSEWLLEMAKAGLGTVPITDITAADILQVLRPLEAADKLETARRLRFHIGSVFRHAIVTDRATSDPTQALKGAIARPKTQHRPAITDEVAFGSLLRAIDGFVGQPTTRAALQLMALLACRPGELRQATWSEFDLNARIWNIPAKRMKMRKPHRIPLPSQSIEILKGLYEVTGRGVAGLLFPGLRSVSRPISENTMNGALRRLGYSQDEVTAHGFRSTFSTLANESGKWSVNAIEAALAHIEPNIVRRSYARSDYWDERVRLMVWWADQCDVLRNGATVIHFEKEVAGIGQAAKAAS